MDIDRQQIRSRQLDQAIRARLARLRYIPVNTARLEQRVREQLQRSAAAITPTAMASTLQAGSK